MYTSFTMRDELIEDAKKLYENAKTELIELTKTLAELEQTRAKAEQRIAQLRKLMIGLEPMLAGEDVIGFIDSAFPDLGLKGMIVGVLGAASKSLTPSEIVYELRELFRYDIDKYSNPIAVVTTTLKRMIESGEAGEETRPDGKTAYKLIGPFANAFGPMLGGKQNKGILGQRKIKKVKK
jgi:hypothetical protein